MASYRFVLIISQLARVCNCKCAVIYNVWIMATKRSRSYSSQLVAQFDSRWRPIIHLHQSITNALYLIDAITLTALRWHSFDLIDNATLHMCLDFMKNNDMIWSLTHNLFPIKLCYWVSPNNTGCWSNWSERWAWVETIALLHPMDALRLLNCVNRTICSFPRWTRLIDHSLYRRLKTLTKITLVLFRNNPNITMVFS